MDEQKEKILINFKKAQGILARVIEMVEADEYCINIMQQNLATVGLLKAAQQALMERHLNTCFRSAMETNNKKRKEEMTLEILRLTRLSNK